MKKFFTLIAAVFASVNMMAQDWGPNINSNSGFEGDDFTWVVAKPSMLADGSANGEIFSGEALAANCIAEGKGVNGSKALEILTAANPAQPWDSQFWINLPEDIDVGEKLHIVFKYRAEFSDESIELLSVGSQGHTTPGNYLDNNGIGDIEFKSEWQEADVTFGPSSGQFSIAFNLSVNTDYTVKFYIDDLVIEREKADETMVKYWKPVVTNGDFEGGNMTNYIVRIYQQGDSNPTPEEGVGVDDSKGLKIVVPAKQSQTWDSQFFIYMNEAIPAGDLIKVEFDYRASEDTPEAIDTQSHGATAGSYNDYRAIGSMTFGTEWKHHAYTQSVSSEQSKDGNPYQNIAFNLAHFDHEVTLYIDNITVKHQVLVPAGENPSKIALDEYIQGLESKYVMDNLAADKSNEAIRDAFAQAYSDALSLGDEDDFEAALDNLSAAEGKYANSVKDYLKLAAHIKLITEKAEQAKTAGYDDLATELEAMIEGPQAAWDAEQVGRDEINEMVNDAAVYAKVREGVMPLIAKGKDVTILMNNSNYYWGTASWAGSFTARANTAEKWHASFDVNQTIANMPKGAYTIKFNGFQRHDTNDDGVTGVHEAEAYANDNSKLLVAGEDGMVDPFPSSMEMAREAFDASDVFQNTLTAVLTEDGDLKIGVRGTNNMNWVIWSDWQIIYEGEGVANYAGALEQAIEKAKAVKEQLEDDLNAPAIDKCDDLTLAAENMVAAIASTSEADAQKMVQALADIVVEMQDAAKLVVSVNDAFYNFESSLNEYEYTAAADIVARAQAAKDKFDDYLNMTTEDLKAYAAELLFLTDALKVDKDAYAATDAAPADMTNLFINPDFQDYAEVGANANYPGWSGSGFGTGGGTAGPVAERWNQSSGFNTYVDFAGLPAGTYMLSCDGAYRTNISADWDIVYGEGTTDNMATLYANTTVDNYSTILHNIAEGKMTAAECEEAGIDYSANCSSLTKAIPTGEKDEDGNDITENVTYYFPDQLFTADQWIQAGKYNNNCVYFNVAEDGKARVGVTRKGAANDWCFLDNFKLTYFGKNSANAIESVETVKVVKGIYTISGVRVNNMNRSGLYIVNGKKVLVK